MDHSHLALHDLLLHPRSGDELGFGLLLSPLSLSLISRITVAPLPSLSPARAAALLCASVLLPTGSRPTLPYARLVEGQLTAVDKEIHREPQ